MAVRDEINLICLYKLNNYYIQIKYIKLIMSIIIYCEAFLINFNMVTYKINPQIINCYIIILFISYRR